MSMSILLDPRYFLIPTLNENYLFITKTQEEKIKAQFLL